MQSAKFAKYTIFCMVWFFAVKRQFLAAPRNKHFFLTIKMQFYIFTLHFIQSRDGTGFPNLPLNRLSE